MAENPFSRVIQAPAGSFNARSIPVGGSRASSLGQAAGAGLGAFLASRVNRSRAEEAQAAEEEQRQAALQQRIERFRPVVESLAASTNNPFVQALAQNPEAINQFPDLAETLAGVQAQEQPEAQPTTRVVSSDSPLNERFKLGIPEGQSARVQFVRDRNGALQVAGGVQGQPFSPDAEETGADFGRGATGRSLANLTNLAPKIQSGEASPEEVRLFQASVTQFTQPRRVFDPVTGWMIDVTPRLPEFVEQANNALASAPAATTAPGAQQVEQPGTQASGFTTLPEDQQIPAPEEIAAQFGASGQPTIFELVQEGNTTGPVPALMRFASAIPGLGIRADEENAAGRIVTGITNRVAASMRQNPRFVEGERVEKVEEFAASPGFFDTPQKMNSELVGVSQLLEQIEKEMESVVAGDTPLVTGETRGMAMDTLNNVRNARRTLTPPLVRDESAYAEWVQTAEPGDTFLAPDENGDWQQFIFEGEQ